MDNERRELSEEQKNLLHKIYYDDKLFVGRDRLSAFIRANYPESKISRRDCQFWLRQQKIWQLTKPVTPRARTSLMDIRKEGYMSCDLKTMAKDRGYNYIFGLVDVASRKQYAAPMRTASAPESAQILKKLLDDNNIHCTLLRSDNGGSFQAEFSAFLKERGIKQLFSDSHSPWQNRQERNFRTMGDMLYKNELATGSKAWVNVLPTIVDNMNSTINRSMKVTPNEASADGLPLELNIDRSKTYGVMKKHLSTKSTLKEGDFVRVKRRDKGNYSKSKRLWSSDVYVVMKVIHQSESRLITYKVSADGNTLEKPSYNITDLLKVNDTMDISYPELSTEEQAVGERSIADQRSLDELLLQTPDVAAMRETRRPISVEDVYVVERILAKRKFGKTLKYKVKWLGYPLLESTWEPSRNLSGARELVKEFNDAHKKK